MTFKNNLTSYLNNCYKYWSYGKRSLSKYSALAIHILPTLYRLSQKNGNQTFSIKLTLEIVN